MKILFFKNPRADYSTLRDDSKTKLTILNNNSTLPERVGCRGTCKSQF